MHTSANLILGVARCRGAEGSGICRFPPLNGATHGATSRTRHTRIVPDLPRGCSLRHRSATVRHNNPTHRRATTRGRIGDSALPCGQQRPEYPRLHSLRPRSRSAVNNTHLSARDPKIPPCPRHTKHRPGFDHPDTGPHRSRRVRSSKVSRRTTRRAAPSDTNTTGGRNTLL